MFKMDMTESKALGSRFFFFFERIHFLKYFLGRIAQQVESEFPDQGLNTCPLHWKHRV